MKRGPKPCLVQLPLTTWMDECADQMVCPTRTEIKDEAIAMAEKKGSVRNRDLPCKFGKTWWKLFKCRNSYFVSRLAQNVESQRACARLSPEQWTEFSNNHLKPGLEKVAYNPCHIWNEVKPDRVVRSRGRSGMGSNIAWHRRHNDSVD